MKQTSSDRPSSVESETTDFNPRLQEALGCLDIKLEDELGRFREYQSQESVQVVEETWLQGSSERDRDSSIISAEIIPPPGNDITLKEGDYEVLPPSEGFGVLEEQPAPHRVQPSRARESYTSVVERDRELVSSPEELDLNFSQGGAIAPFHNEYLASSQELLRQIEAEEPASPTPEPVAVRRQRKFLTPFRFTSIAALCVIAGGGIYAALNPSVLNTLTGTKVATVTTSTTITTSNLGQSIQSPNLAANEFTDINLSNLNTIAVNTAPTTPTVPQTTTTAAPTAANPVVVPYTPVNPQTIAPPAIVQPKIADSLVKSLLPGNFQQLAREYQKIRTSQPTDKKAPN
jgi:hypothetical protein